MNCPILSICIPTYNRSQSLDLLLDNIVKECVAISASIEVVVCDNASTDDTPKIVAKYEDKLPLTSVRRDQNIGIAANIAKTPSEASGKYCWLIGDDDLFVRGAIAEIAGLLEVAVDTSGIVVGYAYEAATERGQVIATGRSSMHANFFREPHRRPYCCVWEETFFETDFPAAFTSIVSMVFHREGWLRNYELLDCSLNEPALTSLETTFPHTLIWARCYAGKSVLFTPEPKVHFFLGDQPWIGKWRTMLFSQVLSLSKEFLNLGCNAKASKHYAKRVFATSGSQLQSLISEPDQYSRKYFSLLWLILNFGHYQQLWSAMFREAKPNHPVKFCKRIIVFFRSRIAANR